MAETMANFKRDSDLKQSIDIDPFYSESNMAYLKKVIDDIESGKAKLVEHNLIDD